MELMALRESVSTRAVAEQAAQLSEQEFQPFILPRRNHCRNLKAPWLVLRLETQLVQQHVSVTSTVRRGASF